MTRTRASWLVVSLAVLAAMGLLLPWAKTGERSRSTIDLLSSAGALEVIEGWRLAALLVGWFAVICAAAASLVLVAWGRPRAASLSAFVVGPALLVSLLVVIESPFSVAWGAWFASGLGATSSIGSGLIVMTPVSRWEGKRA